MQRAVIVGCVLLLAASVAQADLKEGTYAPDIDAKEWLNADQPISLSELHGMVVVLYFWVSWHQGGEYFMPLINIVENSRRFGRKRGVFLVGVTEADRTRVQEIVKEERLFFPIALESKSAKEYDITSFPRVVVIDPNGKIAFTGLFGQNDEQNFITKMDQIFTDTPPTRTHPREAADAQRFMGMARAAIAKGNYRGAFQDARNAVDCALFGDTLRAQCQGLVDLIEAIGRDRLADGMQLLDQKKYADAVAALREVARQFRGMAAGRTAQRRLKGLEERFPDVKKALSSLDRDTEARNLLAGARDSLWSRSFGEAYEALDKIVKDYGDAGVAKDAQTILERMKKNQTIMGYVRDHLAERDCDNWLAQARSYVHAGNYAKAQEYFRKVIDAYPDTKFAEEAYRELGRLK